MIVTSSPAKIILCGEHYVVYGAPAVALPVDKRNSVELETVGNESKLMVQSDFGNTVIHSNGTVEGESTLQFCKPIYLELAKNRKETFRVRLRFGGAPKGMGNSASIASALAMALCTYLDKRVKSEELFRITQMAENLAHNGKASGIDARTVIAGEPQLFRKTFNPVEFHFKKIKLDLPENTKLIAISTYKDKREMTGELIERFARANRISKKPDELSQQERKQLIDNYEAIFNEILGELRSEGKPEELGSLLNKNHELLKNSNVSTAEIDDAIDIAIKNNAYGGKLTGAGGKGGACFALADRKDVERIIKALGTKGYFAFVADLAKHGTVVDMES